MTVVCGIGQRVAVACLQVALRMYESFYGFHEKPFSLLPDPAFLFLGREHRMALVMLEYSLENQAGFTVITGEIGSGKTTLIRALLRNMGMRFAVGLVSNTRCENFEELLQWILFAFELDYKGKDKVGLYHTFVDFLVREYGEGRRVVLIVDEAQQLTPDALEQLRMLSNVNADKNQVLQLILVGQPDLRDLMRRPEQEQFAQRIAVDHHLRGLDPEEARNYIRHRVSLAGGTQDLFDDESCRLIWRYSRGLPRLINILCDTVLVYGFAEQQRRVDANLVQEVMRDKKNGLLPLDWDGGDHSVKEVKRSIVRPQNEQKNIKERAKDNTIERFFKG